MFRKTRTHKIVTALSLLSLLLVLGGFLWAYLALRPAAGSPLILHYNDIRGITQIGGLDTFVFVGIFGIVVVVMNFFIARELAARDRFLATFAASMTLLFSVLLFISFIAILNVN